MAWKTDPRNQGKGQSQGSGKGTVIGGNTVTGHGNDRQWMDAYDHSKGWTGGTGQGQGQTFNVKPACQHTGHTPFRTLSNGMVLYPGQGMKMADTRHLDVVLDLAGLVKVSRPFVASSGPAGRRFLRLNKMVSAQIVRLDWPDMTAPLHVRLEFWSELGKMLAGQHVGVACMGGHGRTGTALAALMVAVDHTPGQDAIDIVRKDHCARAIETKQQESYILGLSVEQEAITRITR